MAWTTPKTWCVNGTWICDLSTYTDNETDLSQPLNYEEDNPYDLNIEGKDDDMDST